MAPEPGANNPEHDTVPDEAVRELGYGAYIAVAFAEAMSSVRLFGLGEQVGFAWYLAWLLPGALDIYALTMLRFSSKVPALNPIRRKAMREATLALTLTVSCNALYEAIRSFAAQLPVWAPGALFVLVSALAPFVAGRIIHFHSMVGSVRDAAGSADPVEVPAVVPQGAAEVFRGTPEPGSAEPAGTVPRDEDGTGRSGSVEPVPEPAAERLAEPKREVPQRRSMPRGTPSRAAAGKRAEATVTSIVAKPEWPAMAKAIVAAKGPEVALSEIMSALGCSKSTASRQRSDAITALAAEASKDAESEPERDLEAS